MSIENLTIKDDYTCATFEYNGSAYRVMSTDEYLHIFRTDDINGTWYFPISLDIIEQDEEVNGGTLQYVIFDGCPGWIYGDHMVESCDFTLSELTENTLRIFSEQ